MMTSTICTCTWLLLPCCVLVTLSTGELDFYRDEVPESSESIALRQLIKYLEGPRTVREHFPTLLASLAHKKHHVDLDSQKREDFLEFLQRVKPKEWNYQKAPYNEPINKLPRDREHYFPLYDLNPYENSLQYSNFKLPYFPQDTSDEDMSFPDDGYGYNGNQLQATFEDTNFDKGMKEVPLVEIEMSYGDLDKQGGKNKQISKPHNPLFTYKFDQVPNLAEKHPFAVKPNDPRYYQEGPFFIGDSDKSDLQKPTKNNTRWEGENMPVEKMHVIRDESSSNIESNFKDTSMILVPELERRTEYSPLFVPINQDLNNDIYFIAIVAGCSAAAMFGLVLIALTWCRLKRGAKAAADIEYPAYGVTGPNKEVSPSGDQRLAQSAQMYHFQHQKQQIIAMENRVSATRDPGSVSEAESEEENEEGDYTVYECPGLASTGEMEVKNPLFHDDPTPATPAQTNKEEDHNNI